MRRRQFITFLGGAAAVWPLAAHGQQPSMPVIGFLNVTSPEANAGRMRAFRQGLKDARYVESENVAIEYRWADNQIDRLPALAADLVRRNVAVIVATTASPPALAAKAATTTIPIVFLVGEDPVRLGLVDNLARPGGNLTGINFFNAEVVAKRLELLHALVPKAVRFAMLVNPENVPIAARTLREVPEAARAIGLQLRILNASTKDEIEAAFVTLAGDRIEALFVAPDPFFISQRDQFATLTARYRIPVAYSTREDVEAGGLMSYGTDIREAYRQVGVFTGRILKGAKPADMPVLQSTKFEFLINAQTAKALGIEVPNSIQLLVDEVIE